MTTERAKRNSVLFSVPTLKATVASWERMRSYGPDS